MSLNFSIHEPREQDLTLWIISKTEIKLSFGSDLVNNWHHHSLWDDRMNQSEWQIPKVERNNLTPNLFLKIDYIIQTTLSYLAILV